MWGLGGSGVVDLLDEAVVSEADARRKLRFGRIVIHFVAQVGEQGPFRLERLITSTASEIEKWVG